VAENHTHLKFEFLGRHYRHSYKCVKLQHVLCFLNVKHTAMQQYSHILKSTGWSKKPDTQFYFWYNYGNSAPILTILSLLQAEIYGA